MKDPLRLYLPKVKHGESFELGTSQQKHVKVLRLTSGDSCEIFDGIGNLFQGELKIEKRSTSVLVQELLKHEEQTNHLVVAIAPTKNIARFEWFIEKATELGVQKIIPFTSFHSERTNLNQERLNRVVESAASQSKELWVPEVSELISFSELLNISASERWIAHCNESGEHQTMQSALSRDGDHLILIGPEGDFSDEEIRQAEEQGFQALTLGEKRLRTETAALAVVLAYSIFNS